MQISQDRRTHQDTEVQASPDTTRSDEGIASSGVTFQLWRLYQHAWLVCLCFPLSLLVSEPICPWRFACAVGLVALSVLSRLHLADVAASRQPESTRARGHALSSRSCSLVLLFLVTRL